MKMQLGKFKVLASGISAMRDDTVKVEIAEGGLSVKCMDPTQISMVEAKTSISLEEDEKETKGMSVNFSQLLKAVKNEKEGIVSVKVNNRDGKIEISSGTSEANFPIGEVCDSPTKTPSLESYADRVSITIEAKVLKDALNEIEAVSKSSKSALFKWEGDLLIIESVSDDGFVKKTIQGAVSKAIKGQVMYPTDYLKTALKVIKSGKVVMLVKKDIPCELSFGVEGVQFRYWVAPQVNSDEEKPKDETTEEEPEDEPEAKTETKVAEQEVKEELAEEKAEEKKEGNHTLTKYKIEIDVESEDEITEDMLDGCWLTDTEFRGALIKLEIKKVESWKIHDIGRWKGFMYGKGYEMEDIVEYAEHYQNLKTNEENEEDFKAWMKVV